MSVHISILFDCALMLLQLALTMLAHECGHIVVARYHGVRVKKISLRPLGPCIERERTTGWPEISICVAGAAVNLALAIAFWHADHWFAVCNFTFAWVNLLPIPHADGLHALEAWRDLRWKRLVERVGKRRMYASL